MPSRADVETLQAANRGLVALARRDLRAFWSTLDLTQPERARDLLLEFMPALVEQYGEAAATVAADFYDDLRAAERAPGRFSARMADVVSVDRVQARTRFAAQHLFTETPSQMLTFLTGAATKYVLEPGRATIVQSTAADPAAAGWHRETRSSETYASGCDFCRMLAGRGSVYKDSTARFAAHDDCHCVALPSWDANAPEVDAMAYVASQRTSAMSPAQRERHNARVRDWIAADAD